MADDTVKTALIGGVEQREISIADYDPAWPAEFEHHAARIRRALGATALQIEHIGSTSVPDLAAKPIIDIVLVVADSSREETYLPQLEGVGYALRVREPEASEHRMLRTPDLDVHIHVYSLGSREVRDYLALRNRLRTSGEDRRLYEETKRRLAAHKWSDMNQYAEAKTEVISHILARAKDPASSAR